MPRFTSANGFVILELTFPITIADSTILVFGAPLRTGGTSIILVTFTFRTTTFEYALSFTTTDFAPRSRTGVAARWPDVSILAIALPNTFRQGTQTTMAAYFCILVGWTWNRAIFAKPALLAHAFHDTLVRNTVALAKAWLA